MFAPGLDGGNDFEEVTIANEIFYSVSSHQDLALRHPHIEFRTVTQALRDHSEQAISQLGGYAAPVIICPNIGCPPQR